MYFSVPGILSFGLFGVPFTGSDICGFIGNTTEELCLRWHQLGSLYPFSRNHNTIGAASQEPYVWPNTVLPSARQALEIRYSLIPYFYTLHDKAHKTGKPVWQPLFFRFPEDPAFVLKIDRQFLLGDAIMVSPALYKGQIQVKAYFPGKGRWFDLWTHQIIIEADRDGQAVASPKFKARADGGDDERAHRYKFLSAKMESEPIPMSMEGGHIITIHQSPKLTVAETRLQPLSLIVALDDLGSAKGEIVVDDGTSVNNNAQANVSWELQGGQKLVSNAQFMSSEQGGSALTAAQVQSFKASVGHSDVIEKVVIMGLNFARAGGEQDADAVAGQVVFDVTDTVNKQTHHQLHRQGQRKHQRRDDNEAEAAAAKPPAQRATVVARVNALEELNINGVPVSFGGAGGVAPANRTKGVDPVSGMGWEVNEAVGSLTLTGLKMDLFAGWFINWKLQ